MTDDLILEYNNLYLLMYQQNYSSLMNNSLKLLRKKYKNLNRRQNTTLSYDQVYYLYNKL